MSAANSVRSRVAIATACPGISEDDHKRVAEVLACCTRPAEARRAHRLRKIETFPEECRERIKRYVNAVIAARRATA